MRLFVVVGMVIWIWALVSLCSRRDIEIHSKVSWVVTVLVLNAAGALLYFIFGPRGQIADADRAVIDVDAVPITPEGTSWNPILGDNRMAEGEGLNPRQEEHQKEPSA